ncbi:hypothetical protein JW926_16780 [Candidatus Sumerlaeota bacterium]|nr:hypothetical protein [Candidatus Sumerlaeota bacterium]
MAHVFTPGLQVIAETIIEKDRSLPIPGKVFVKSGDRVKAEDVIAEAEIPNDIQSMNVVNLLSVMPKEIHQFMLKKEGDPVEEHEPIAQNKPFLGIKLFQSIVRSPFKGTIERISDVTGQVLIRKPPRRITLLAYIDGVVKNVAENLGAEIETACAFIQGIFGIGGEAFGELTMVSPEPSHALDEADITESHAGKILVGGSHISHRAFKKAMEMGVKGIIVGGFHAKDLKNILGYELGVAITGDEDVKTTLIVTEGFGKMAMADRTFDLLRKNQGRRVSISGRTQIRAGVMRPEIIVTFSDKEAQSVKAHVPKAETGIQIGDEVRIIREPFFGRLGNIMELPPELTKIETEAKVRVMKVKLASTGEVVTIPRANVELIEV